MLQTGRFSKAPIFGAPDKTEASRHKCGSTFRFHNRRWKPPGPGRGKPVDRRGLSRPCDPDRSGFFCGEMSDIGGSAWFEAKKERNISQDRTRINEQIRISPVRLIDDEGGQVGIVSIEEARDLADDRGLDLVEVAPEARPPVVKLMDYGKFKYEAQRAAREAKKKQHHVQVKEVKFRPGIEQHDYDFKTRHARRFLEEGNKVKLTMMFRGRQVTHPELGREVLLRVTEDLKEVGMVESRPSFEGRVMSMVLAPIK